MTEKNEVRTMEGQILSLLANAFWQVKKATNLILYVQGSNFGVMKPSPRLLLGKD